MKAREDAMKTRDFEIALKFKNLLRDKVKLHQAILFGSRARGDADPESDMDILVILDEEQTSSVRDIVSDCAWQVGFDSGLVVAPVVFSREEWENGPERSSLLAMAMREEGVSI